MATVDRSPENLAILDNLRRLQRVARFCSETGRGTDHEENAPLREWGHLELREELGRGSFGVVWKAFDTLLEREVALKLRSPETSSDRARNYIDEARRLARVRHPHVLAVHGADVHEGLVGLWADLLEGQTLDEVLDRRARLTFLEVLELGSELAEALAAVHDAGLVHGDVKGANIMIEPGLGAVLMDFGAGTEAASGSAPLYGTPAVMAPELFAGASASPESDAYALGTVLYRMLTGRATVPPADRLVELAELVEAMRPADLQFPSEVPWALRQVVRDLLARVPGERPNMKEVISRLEWIETAPARLRRRAAYLAVVVSLAAGLVLASIGYLRSVRSEERAQLALREAEAVGDFLSETLQAPRLLADGPGVKLVEVLDGAESRLERLREVEPGVAARALEVLGTTWLQLGMTSRAESALRSSYDSYRKSHGPESNEALWAGLSLSNALISRFELEEAEGLIDDFFDYEERFSRDSAVRIDARVYLGRLEERQGDHEAALATLREAVQLRPGDEWELDPSRRLAELELADVLSRSGDPLAAEPMYADLLERQLAVDGERNGNTLAVLHNYAIALDLQGRPQEAETLFRRCVEILDDWLDDPLQSATCRAGLAAALGYQARYREAAGEGARLIELLRDLPERRATLAVVLGNHAIHRMELGELEVAEDLFREAHALAAEAIGPDAQVTLLQVINLGELFLRTHRHREAFDSLSEVAPRAVDALGLRNPTAASAQALLGASELELGIAGAELRLEEAWKALLESSGPGFSVTLQAQVLLAEARARSGSCPEALRLVDEFAERSPELNQEGGWLNERVKRVGERCDRAP